jgi:hypothetical protein
MSAGVCASLTFSITFSLLEPCIAMAPDSRDSASSSKSRESEEPRSRSSSCLSSPA